MSITYCYFECQTTKTKPLWNSFQEQFWTIIISIFSLSYSDLEFSVEELRNDVISRQCRVNMADVEGMALLLSNLTKQMADLKGSQD